MTFWYSKDASPLFVLKAHTSAITQMRWNEHLQQLITCGKDKSIKVWQIPNRWIDETLKAKTQIEDDEEEVTKRDYRTGCEG